MLTSWVLIMAFAYDRSASVATIPNLKDMVECRRVREEIKKGIGNPPHIRMTTAQCIEVTNK